MSSKAIVNRVVDLLTAGFPNLTVLKGNPRTLPNGDVLYVYHQGRNDRKKAGQGIIKRTHLLAIELRVHLGIGDAAAEDLLMDTADALADLWYTHHRLTTTAGGDDPIADTAVLTEPDGEDVRSAFPAYVIDGSQEYRARQFVLSVEETVGFTMS